ncbi:MAG: hypothetical protein RLZZ97_1067, partial [Gemmatimonadota bacterium]
MIPMNLSLRSLAVGLLCAAAPLGAQGVVTGSVTDPNGRPLSGVLVTVDGTAIRAATQNGTYRAANV